MQNPQIPEKRGVRTPNPAPYNPPHSTTPSTGLEKRKNTGGRIPLAGTGDFFWLLLFPLLPPLVSLGRV